MKPITQKLNKSDIERFKEKLEVQRGEARELLRRAEEEQRGLDTDRPPDLGDFCVASATREYLFERASQQRRLLNRIERALQRIQAGTFGECITCGEEIKRKRLEVMPWTECCLQCQDERERMARASHSPSFQYGRPQRVA